MVDVKGNTLSVGDRVVFIANANSNPTLKMGSVTKIYSNDKECSVGKNSHIYSNRIMQLNND